MPKMWLPVQTQRQPWLVALAVFKAFAGGKVVTLEPVGNGRCSRPCETPNGERIR